MDELAALSSLGIQLAHMEKVVTLVCPNKETLPEPLHPLIPVQKTIGPLQSLHVRLPVDTTKLSAFSYNLHKNQLDIEILAKQGSWSENDVTAQASVNRFDGLIALNISLAEIDQLAPEAAGQLHQLPSLHLTNSKKIVAWTNESVLLTTSSSLSEDVYAWLKTKDTPINKELAHNLLIGLISATNGFRNDKLQSRTLENASELVKLGADRQAIMNRLWRTMSISTLNLWGRALMRLTLHPSLPLAWTMVTDHDYLQAGTNDEGLPTLGAYLLDRLPESNLCLILSAWNGIRKAHLFTRAPLEARMIADLFQGTGTEEQAVWTLAAPDLLEAQREVLTVMERELPRFLSAR